MHQIKQVTAFVHQSSSQLYLLEQMLGFACFSYRWVQEKVFDILSNIILFWANKKNDCCCLSLTASTILLYFLYKNISNGKLSIASESFFLNYLFYKILPSPRSLNYDFFFVFFFWYSIAARKTNEMEKHAHITIKYISKRTCEGKDFLIGLAFYLTV